MKYKTKEDFIADIGIRKLGLVEYIANLELEGKTEHEIQGILLSNKVSKTPRTLDADWKFYKTIRPKVSWI